MSYDALARYYDALTGHVDYEPWLALLERHAAPGDLILDAACGTGTLTAMLTERGYSVIAVDASPSMLTEARQKTSEPLFLCQRLEDLDLYGTVKAAVCSLDALNYITKPETLQRAFQRISLFLEPGGFFVFDLKTPEALSEMHGQSNILQTGDVFCAWETHCRKPFCYHDLILFARENDHWRRFDERHTQRAYPPDWILNALREADFVSADVLMDILPEQGRVFIAAGK